MSVVRRSAVIVVSVIVTGVVGAVAWAQLAEPAHWQVSDGHLIMTEEAAAAEFGVLVWFVVIGATLSFVLGFLGQLALRSEWSGVVAMALAAVAGGLLAWRLGIAFGPPDPRSVVDARQGDLVPDQLGLGSPVPFFAWPLGALLGVLIATWFERDPDAQDRATDATTAWTDEIRS